MTSASALIAELLAARRISSVEAEVLRNAIGAAEPHVRGSVEVRLRGLPDGSLSRVAKPIVVDAPKPAACDGGSP